jgi:enoyl-CoA hydratase/carnithine racemase
MTYSCFDLIYDGAIAHLRLNNPDKRNAMTIAFWNELPEAIAEIDQSGKTRAIVISAEGPHFTAGIDLNAFATLAANLGAGDNDTHKKANAGLGFIENVKLMQGAFTALEACRIPVLCAIQGGCIGGGVDMVSAADMRYCTSDAYFTIYEINIGMTADVGTFPRLLNLLPEGVVRELAFTGRKMSAEEAAGFGLVNKVFADEKALLDGVLEIAREIAGKAPLAIHGIKQAITYSRDHNTADSLDRIALWNASLLQQSEIMAAMVAKQTKQQGDFAPLTPIKKVGD